MQVEMKNSATSNVSYGKGLYSLIPIKPNCDSQHKHCVEVVKFASAPSYVHLITQEYFDSFIDMVGASKYYCCLSSYNSKNCFLTRGFIISNSVKFTIKTWDAIITYMSDDELYKILLNQQAINPNINSELIDLNITDRDRYGYGIKTNFLNSLITRHVKSFTQILLSLKINEFIKYLNVMTKSFYSSIEDAIIKYIEKNKNELKCNVKNKDSIKLLNAFITKPKILISLYPLVSDSINNYDKKEIFNKCISSMDKNLIILMLENKDIIPDIITINKLVEKSYASAEGSPNSKMIANIIDLLCDYGLKIDKPIILKLLSHGCCVNNLEKHGLTVDNDILAKCADVSYYPYKFDIVPNLNILKKECSKHNNLNTLRKLKEFGAIYTPECLEIACGMSRNGKVIKFLINECGVRVTDKCLDEYQQAYKIDSLEHVIKKYKEQIPVKKTDSDEQKYFEINEKSTMVINPRNIKIDQNNNNLEYKLKNKIRKFFDCKKKTIKYLELYEMFLKYLIENKLVIGKYFVINVELSILLKINHCVIMNTNQIHNILTYFVEELNPNEIKMNEMKIN